MNTVTIADLDFDGARELWGRIFDLSSDQIAHLYDEAYKNRTGYHKAYWRLSDLADEVVLDSGAILVSSSSSNSGAALARLVRPTIGRPGGITQADYDLVSGPWRAVIGPVHDDDDHPERITP